MHAASFPLIKWHPTNSPPPSISTFQQMLLKPHEPATVDLLQPVTSPPLHPYKREPHLIHFLHNSLLPPVLPLPTSCCPSSSSNPPPLRSITVGPILIASLLLKLVVRIPACSSSCGSHPIKPPWPEPSGSVSSGELTRLRESESMVDRPAHGDYYVHRLGSWTFLLKNKS
jgi:hypothetical protein